MSEVGDLQRASELADAKLEVAEEFNWPLAILAATVVYMKWDSWLLAFGIGAVVFYLAAAPYRRASAKAEEDYFKEAKLGKYAHFD